MISFKVNNVKDFIEAYQTVFRTTQLADLSQRDLCCMEVGEGKVYFYRFDGGIYTQAWCDAEISEGGKEVVSAKGFEPLKFCEGNLTVTKYQKKGNSFLQLQSSRGPMDVLETSQSPDLYRRYSPTTMFSPFPVDPRSLLWTDGEFLKIGSRYMETAVGSIEMSYYIHPEPIMEKIAFFPTDKDALLEENSQFACDTGVFWIRNGNVLHRVSAKSDVFQDDNKSFSCTIFSLLERQSCITLKLKDLRDAMAYALSITVESELHYGRCSIRYSGDGVLHVENMRSERMAQEETLVPLIEGERFGTFDISVLPGRVVSCLDAMGGETVRVDTIATAVRFTNDMGIVSAMAFQKDNWRKNDE
jgi:hypothetical protein